MRATLKTAAGYLSTLITRYTPLDLSRPSLEGIFNVLPITNSILTSGQPTEAQLQCVRDAGYRHVINLAPQGIENALPDERRSLEALGMQYVHIPVDFKNPTEAHFVEFCEALQGLGETKVLVHCAANMRVSAFMFRYRRDILHEPTDRLLEDLHKIWEPFGVWKKFIAAPTSSPKTSP